MSNHNVSQAISVPAIMDDANELDALRIGLRRISDMVDNLRRTNEAYGHIEEIAQMRTAEWPFVNEARDPVSFNSDKIRSIIRNRRMREEMLSTDLFSDPAWDMLLDLYCAHLDYKRVSVSSLCIASAVPATTALRWIGVLTDAGLVERICDHLDGRRIWVQLTSEGVEKMTDYFNKASVNSVYL